MTRTIRGWFTAAAILTFASVVMGAVVAATQSGASCPNWPGCYIDQFAPAAQLSPLIEFTHRVIAGATGPTVLVATILGRRLVDPRPRRLAWIALAGALAAGVFGMLTVKVGIPWWLGMLDLACALTAMVSLLVARVLLATDTHWAPDWTARVAWGALGLLTVLHLTGIAVAGPASFTRVLSWPLGVLPPDRWPVLQSLRAWLAVAACALIVTAVVRASGRRGLWRVGLPAGLLLVAELGIGAALLSGQGSAGMRTAYAVVAAGVFGAVALLAARASVVRRLPETPDETLVPVTVTAE